MIPFAFFSITKRLLFVNQSNNKKNYTKLKTKNTKKKLRMYIKYSYSTTRISRSGNTGNTYTLQKGRLKYGYVPI